MACLMQNICESIVCTVMINVHKLCVVKSASVIPFASQVVSSSITNKMLVKFEFDDSVINTQQWNNINLSKK